MNRFLFSGLVVGLLFGCSSSVNTIQREDDSPVAEPDDPEAGSGGAGAGAFSSGGTTQAGGSPAGSSGGSVGLGGAPGSPMEGEIVGEFRFDFSGAPVSNTNTMGTQVVSLVPLPDTTTVTSDLDGYDITTGVAGSMVFLVNDCTDIDDQLEECTLEIVSFGGSPSSMGDPGTYAFDGRLGTFAKQESFFARVVRDGASWNLPETDLGLILDATTIHGETTNRNATGSGPDFLTVDNPSGMTQHRLWIEAFEASCSEDHCDVTFAAFLRE